MSKVAFYDNERCMSPKNYYEILEVPPYASSAEIKRSYHKLARKFHPDSGTEYGSEVVFQKLSEAYQVLSNPQKRKNYNLTNGISISPGAFSDFQKKRDSSDSSGANTAHHSTDRSEKLFRTYSHVSSDASGLNNLRFEGRAEEFTQARAPLFEAFSVKNILSSLVDSLSRYPKIQLPLARLMKNYIKTPENFGKPIREPESSLHPFIIDALESILGTTRNLSLEQSPTPRVIRVSVPPGIEHGSMLKVEAPSTEHHPARTLKVRIEIHPHMFVERDGRDIILKVPISFSEALTGVEVEIPTLDGATRVRIPEQTKGAKRLRLQARGIRSTVGLPPGDLYIRPIIVPPDVITDSLKHMAGAIESYYQSDLRAELPKTFK